jgi:hypothetical protein
MVGGIITLKLRRKQLVDNDTKAESDSSLSISFRGFRALTQLDKTKNTATHGKPSQTAWKNGQCQSP